jgi:16S rRNA (adenine1518-N6/adenine1519-N6)-dimethyltransferase
VDDTLLSPLREEVKALSADKTLGQHFLVDESLCTRIATCAGILSGKTVIEIGPGPGGLTRALLARGASVCAIEKDPRCTAALAPLQTIYGNRFRIYWKDALSVDITTLIPSEIPKPLIVANLPYNIASLLFLQWLPHLVRFEKWVLMFQKEVADRLCAAPCTKDYGRLSVLAQSQASLRKELFLPPGAFVPPPQVYSTVICCTSQEKPPSFALYSSLERLTQRAFAMRRKMLKNTLRPLFSEQELCTLGISPQSRAETLTITQFLSLAKKEVKERASI